MKIIDLFNDIYNKKAPAKFRYNNEEFFLVENEELPEYMYLNENKESFFIKYNWTLDLELEEIK